MVQHNNIIRLFINDQQIFDFSERDKWTLFHSYCFDFSVWEMFGALLFGGELVVISKETTQDTLKFIGQIEKYGITILNQVPGAFYNLIDKITGNEKLNLKCVIFGGDTLHPYKLKPFKEKFPKVKLINMFGITETTVHVTYKEITSFEIENKISNIGQAIPTMQTYVLDKNLKLLPRGIPGELYVAGEGLTRGYLNKKQLTNEKFISNPFHQEQKIYKTGDLVRYLLNGDLEYLGRIDNQVQLRGYRIELGEIEYHIRQFKGVKDAIVSVCSDNNEDKIILAYFITETNTDIIIEELHKYLVRVLPKFMIPSFLFKIDQIPLTAAGKIDKKQLPVPNDLLKKNKNIKLPSNEIEENLMKIWEEVLNIYNFSIEDDFFEIGGHSLRAIKVTSLIHKKFNIEIRLGDFFENPTIKELAQFISLIKWNNTRNEPKSDEIEILL
jgi:acyl-CoA synthetase (AMP-forming)/AMP-acid ligase II/acyl carrier protein